MNAANGKPGSARRKQIWKAASGIAAFVGVGLLLTPGLMRREPAPPQPPESSVQPGESAPLVPSTVTATLAEAGAWLDDGPGPAGLGADPAASDRAFDCMIGPSEVVDVGSAITGVIDEILVERSDVVEAGQVVARLEATVEEAAAAVARARADRTDDIESSRTNLALSEKRLARAKGLFDRDVLSLDSLQEVEAQYELALLEVERAQEDHRLARLQLEQARAALERRTIRTPVAGVVTERLLDAGEVVDEETLLRIARIDPLKVEAILPAEWFGRMEAGEAAEVVPEAPLDMVREAEVAIVDRVLDGASGTFAVELDLPNTGYELPAGLRCQVRFTGPKPAAVARAQQPPSLGESNWEPVPAD